MSACATAVGHEPQLSSIAAIIFFAVVIGLMMNGHRGWALGLLGAGFLLFTPAGWFVLMVLSLLNGGLP
jgi:hypothetical protein